MARGLVRDTLSLLPSTSRFTWRPIAVLTACVAVAAVVGNSQAASTASPTAQARAAGMAQAKAAGPKVTLPKKTVGFVNFNGALSAARRQQDAIAAAAKAIGWKLIPCDAQGNLAKFATCGSSLLDQKVDFIVTPGVDAAYLGNFPKVAKQRGVPVINAGGAVAPSKLFAASYAADDYKVGRLLAAWLVKKLKPLSGEQHIVNATFPLTPYIAMSKGLLATIKGTNITVVDSPVTNGADPTGGTKQQTLSALQSDPSIKAIWINYGSSAPLGACEAINALPQFRGKSFPDRPMVLTRLGELDALQLIRTGCIGAVVDYPYPIDGWVAIDQAAQYAARNKPFSRSTTPKYGNFNYFDYAIITKDNLPPPGKFRKPVADAPTFFSTKWANEFTK